MFDFDEERDEWPEDEIVDTICVACDLPAVTNDLGLCSRCYAKLERDLIRDRDWDRSATAFMTPSDQLEELRRRVIREYGADYELIVSPDIIEKPKRKNKRSKSRTTQHKRKIAAQARRDYDTDDVLQAARDFIQRQDEEWVNFSRVAQHLHETFYNLKPKHLGPTSKKYNSLLKFLKDYPSDFELREDIENHGLYWIRLI